MICLRYILWLLGYYRNVTPISDCPLLPALTRYLDEPTHALPSDAVHVWDKLPINIYLLASSFAFFRFPLWLLEFFLGFCLFGLDCVMILKAVYVVIFWNADQCIWAFIPSSLHHFILRLLVLWGHDSLKFPMVHSRWCSGS